LLIAAQCMSEQSSLSLALIAVDCGYWHKKTLQHLEYG